MKAKLDIRELPAYTISEAANYLRIPASTLRWWVTGRSYHVETGHTYVKPIIKLPDPKLTELSFINLTEIHVLDAIRRRHRIPLPKVRSALDYLQRHFPCPHPLVQEKFETDGMDLFTEKYGHLLKISQQGQLAIRELIHAHLQRIEWDPTGVPIKLYPFVRKKENEEPRFIVIDPYVSFGRPTITGTGIATAVVASRFRAGETLEALAKDYGRSVSQIEEAIRCELYPEAA